MKIRNQKPKGPDVLQGIFLLGLFLALVAVGYWSANFFSDLIHKDKRPPAVKAQAKKARPARTAKTGAGKTAATARPVPGQPASSRTVPAPAGTIAIIIDDNGYNPEACRNFSAIPQPVTLAVLPHLPHSRTVSACAHSSGREVMLHLPLEPHELKEDYPTAYIITTRMPNNTVLEGLDKARQSVPYAAGINNHMGSKATEDHRIMSVILDYVGREGLFFVDSRVTLRSAAPRLARQKKVLFTERDVFLDNENDKAYIEGQFRELAKESRLNGFAVGIGHDRPMTWTVLKEQADRLEREGFRFVTVKDLILQAGGK